MWFVADGAIFNNWRMLKGVWSLFVRVAPIAEIIQPFICFQHANNTPMRVMAITALHFSLAHWMVGWIVHPGFHISVAAIAELRITLL